MEGASPFNFPNDENSFTARRIELINIELYNRYAAAVRDYNISMDAGRDYPGPVPTVPKGYKIGPPDSYGYTAMVLSDGVFEPIPLHTKVKSTAEIQSKKNFIHILHATVGGGGIWFTAAEDDTFPSGETTPPTVTDDGISGIFQRVAGPVGNGWYKKVG